MGRKYIRVNESKKVTGHIRVIHPKLSSAQKLIGEAQEQLEKTAKKLKKTLKDM